jgi:hypothetical protein
MMLMSTVVAVALGLAPVSQDGSVNGDYSAAVGRYSQTIDAQGKTHARGFSRQTGAPYDVAMDKDGNVEAQVGDWIVTFRVRDAG